MSSLFNAFFPKTKAIYKHRVCFHTLQVFPKWKYSISIRVSVSSGPSLSIFIHFIRLFLPFVSLTVNLLLSVKLESFLRGTSFQNLLRSCLLSVWDLLPTVSMATVSHGLLDFPALLGCILHTQNGGLRNI